jgi:hypothetical protein
MQVGSFMGTKAYKRGKRRREEKIPLKDPKNIYFHQIFA